MNSQSDSLMMISFSFSIFGDLERFQHFSSRKITSAEIHHTSSLSVMNISSHIKHFVSENVIGFDITIRRVSWIFSPRSCQVFEADCGLFWSRQAEHSFARYRFITRGPVWVAETFLSFTDSRNYFCECERFEVGVVRVSRALSLPVRSSTSLSNTSPTWLDTYEWCIHQLVGRHLNTSVLNHLCRFDLSFCQTLRLLTQEITSVKDHCTIFCFKNEAQCNQKLWIMYEARHLLST